MMYRTRRRGSAIAEFGPAIFIFFVIIFFPLLAILGLGLQYACGWYLNHTTAREVAVTRQSEWGTAITDCRTQFEGSSLHNFIKGTYTGAATPDPGQPPSVTVTTTATFKPFISIPFVGITDRMTFTYVTTRPREEVRN